MKTLGGGRLGAGKKMKVSLKNYERSTHDLSYIWRSSMSAGTLVPFMCEIGLPGDTFDIDLNVDVKTLPTIGPLFGSYKVQLDLFTAPIRLYSDKLTINALNVGMEMEQVVLPYFALEQMVKETQDLDNSQINPSSILKYLGISGIGYNSTGNDIVREFNAIPLLAYWDIYKNYYANKQEKNGAVVHVDAPPVINKTIENFGVAGAIIDLYPTISASTTPITGGIIRYDWLPGAAVPNPATVNVYLEGYGWMNFYDVCVAGSVTIDTGANEVYGTWNPIYYTWVKYYGYIDQGQTVTNKPKVVMFDLENIDRMRKFLMRGELDLRDANLDPYTYIWETPSGIPNILSSQEGLGLKTYQSDVFNNWLDTTWINNINTATAVSTVGNSFNIDQLVLAKKVYEMMNRIAVSGGSYEDWIEAVYDHKYFSRATNPVYHGGLIKELVFQEVVSNTQTEEQPLGTLAGKGTMAKKHKGGKAVIKCDEHCIIIGIVSLTPRIDYSQGNRWFTTEIRTMNDFHKPQLDEIGFQDLIQEQMAWWTTYYDSGWTQRSAGKQPAWINYMTNYNRTYGNFAVKTKEMFMTLNRRYEYDESNIVDLTTYIDPSKYNFIFAETALDSQNFWVQIGSDITARRKMSAKVMPNL